mmetsp:Transcript_36278/g.117291  ORF Transcript_36278/g.117291 Transcript_36278/m.117291 type:complete len:243 (-) Transcript_36278:17-745(-)
MTVNQNHMSVLVSPLPVLVLRLRDAVLPRGGHLVLPLHMLVQVGLGRFMRPAVGRNLLLDVPVIESIIARSHAVRLLRISRLGVRLFESGALLMHLHLFAVVLPRRLLPLALQRSLVEEEAPALGLRHRPALRPRRDVRVDGLVGAHRGGLRGALRVLAGQLAEGASSRGRREDLVIALLVVMLRARILRELLDITEHSTCVGRTLGHCPADDGHSKTHLWGDIFRQCKPGHRIGARRSRSA